MLLGAAWSLHPHLSLYWDVRLDGLIPNSFWSKPDLYGGGGFVNSDFLLSIGILKMPGFYLGYGNGFCCATCYLGFCITTPAPAHQRGQRFLGWGFLSASPHLPYRAVAAPLAHPASVPREIQGGQDQLWQGSSSQAPPAHEKSLGFFPLGYPRLFPLKGQRLLEKDGPKGLKN